MEDVVCHVKKIRFDLKEPLKFFLKVVLYIYKKRKKLNAIPIEISMKFPSINCQTDLKVL